MTQLDPNTVTALQGLIKFLDEQAPLSEAQRKELYEAYAKKIFQKMFDTGMTYGEVSGAPGTALSTRNEAEFRNHLRSIDNNLEAQVKIVSEGVEHYFKHGEMPPPYYAWRIAVILRKHKQYGLEADFLECFTKHFYNGLGARYIAIADRAPKARRLADQNRTSADKLPHGN